MNLHKLLSSLSIIGVFVGIMAFSAVHCEEHAFTAEVTQMMDILIHSLYKIKGIFLRELIANASDALDKLRQLSLTDKSLVTNDYEFKIDVKADLDKRTLVIRDTGIGMTKAEMKTNLGTIARSGTKEFIEKFKDQAANDSSKQIGQFGVGFYSSFLAGNRVQVISKTLNGEKNLWECDITKGTFTIQDCPADVDAENPIETQGTKVIIHLNPISADDEDYSKEETLAELIHRYSEFINFPIYLYTRKSVTTEVPVEEDAVVEEKTAEDSEKKEDKIKVEDVSEEEGTAEKKDDKPKTKKVTTETAEYSLINNNKPIWTREPSTIEADEYVDFYKAIAKDTKAPHDWTHFKVEGATTDFRGLIYIGTKPHFQLLSNDQPTDFIKLYVKRVFITSEFPDFPRYLSFITAVVDAEDITLNVSRETLQQSKAVKEIRNRVISKTMGLLNKMAKNETVYPEFYNTYANNLKLGVISENDDTARKNDLAGLLRFHTSAFTDKMTSLADYIGRMKTNQTEIYFATGTDVASIRSLPYVQSLIKNHAMEVLLMTDTYDEYVCQALPEFSGKTLKNVAKGGITLAGDNAEDEKKRIEDATQLFKPLSDYLLKLFAKRIEKVSISLISKLPTDSPVSIVANSFGWSPTMERLMKANASGGKDDPMAAFFGRQKKILEINPNHPLIIGLLARVKADQADGAQPDAVAQKELVKDIRLLYDASLLHSGYELKNPAAFATRVEDMLRSKYNVEPLPQEDVLAAEQADNDDAARGPGGFDMPDFGDMGGMGGMGGGDEDFSKYMDAMKDHDAAAPSTGEHSDASDIESNPEAPAAAAASTSEREEKDEL